MHQIANVPSQKSQLDYSSKMMKRSAWHWAGCTENKQSKSDWHILFSRSSKAKRKSKDSSNRTLKMVGILFIVWKGGAICLTRCMLAFFSRKKIDTWAPLACLSIRLRGWEQKKKTLQTEGNQFLFGCVHEMFWTSGIHEMSWTSTCSLRRASFQEEEDQ